jgi:hypothetical protein
VLSRIWKILGSGGAIAKEIDHANNTANGIELSTHVAMVVKPPAYILELSGVPPSGSAIL